MLAAGGARTHVREVKHTGHGVGSEREGVRAEHHLDVVDAHERKVKPMVCPALHVVVAPTLVCGNDAVASESRRMGLTVCPPTLASCRAGA